MPECSNCGYDNRPGELICQNCGYALTQDTIGTKNLPDEEGMDQTIAQVDPSQRVVRLVVHDFDVDISFTIDHRVFLGRHSGNTGTLGTTSSFINLTPYEAVEKGVSRRHAMLSWDDFQLMVCDLGSSNHTYLNGQRLTENRDYAVRDGDELWLGRLALTLYVEA